MTAITNPERAALERIALARAARTPVDANGLSIGERATFTYGSDGKLEDVTPPSTGKD